MEILNNIEWYFGVPESANNIHTYKRLTNKILKTIVFDDSVKENVKICFPLNNNFSFTETREYSRPLSIKKILEIIRNLYKEPLKTENIEKAFEDNGDWKENVIEKYDGDVTKIVNMDVFRVRKHIKYLPPVFCGLRFDEKSDEYFVVVGTE